MAAARQLFSQKGYFATKVDEIAVAARVSPATVYAVTGGKQGLLRTLIDDWSVAPVVAEARERIEKLDDPTGDRALPRRGHPQHAAGIRLGVNRSVHH